MVPHLQRNYAMTTPLTYAEWHRLLPPARLAQIVNPHVAYADYLHRVRRARIAKIILIPLAILAFIGAKAGNNNDDDAPQPFDCSGAYSRIVLMNNHQYRNERLDRIRITSQYGEAERVLHEGPSKKHLEKIDEMNKKINNLRLEILNLGNEYLAHTECNVIDRANIKSVVDFATNDK
jgi:hypothetical protein